MSHPVPGHEYGENEKEDEGIYREGFPREKALKKKAGEKKRTHKFARRNRQFKDWPKGV